MLNLLGYMLKNGVVTAADYCTSLLEDLTGLPKVTANECIGVACNSCSTVCPTNAITVDGKNEESVVSLDLGRCIGCALCTQVCSTGTLVNDLSLKTAKIDRESLVQTNAVQKEGDLTNLQQSSSKAIFRRSIAARVVSTGCSACDLEISACSNPIFDMERFGIQIVASPRFADVLIVTGPVPKAMHDPLRRCYEAMAEPRAVIALGTCAISGGIHKGGYTEAEGVANVLPVDVFIPGCPPHPWSIIDGIRTAMKKIHK